MRTEKNRRAEGLIRLVLAVGTLLLMAGLGQSMAYAAADYSVFVGYADTVRANPANFPTPFAGTAGVSYQGCDPATCSFDGGVIRIVNNTTGPITIDGVALNVDTCAFTLWTFPVTLQFGGQLILAQTTSGADNGCTSNGHMDTSDIGPGGEGYAGVCTPDQLIPTVAVTENVGGSDVTTTYNDSGRVINTGGVDAASCTPPPGPNNESTQWTSIGSPSCGSANLTLSPPTQTHPEGGTATVTATLTCSNGGAPLSGAPVNLAILSGPNASHTFSPGTTGSSGTVSFNYMDPIDNLGTDVLQASVTNLAGTFSSNKVNAIWTEQPLDCSMAAPSVGILWPPNHKFVPVTITGVTDPESLPITTTITSIRQDQPTLEPGSGNFCPDASGLGTSTANLRAERAGGDPNGRVYHVAFTATDSEGAACTGQVTVCVPHDQSPPVQCKDEAQSYDSTVCAP